MKITYEQLATIIAKVSLISLKAENVAKKKPKTEVEEVIPQSPNAVMRFGMWDGNIATWIFKVDRFEKIGFGFFLKDIKEGEIEVTQEAYDIIANGSFRRGLRPMEIFPENMIGFCDRVFPPKELSVHDGASVWFKKCCFIVKE